MASNIRVGVDQATRGLVIRWFEDGLERHVWVDDGKFEEMLASGETVYVDTPAVATEQPYAPAVAIPGASVHSTHFERVRRRSKGSGDAIE